MVEELKKDEVQKDLQKMVKKEKESRMSEDEKKAQDKEQAEQKAEQLKQDETKKADALILAKKEEERSPEEKERAKAIVEETKKAEEAKAKADEAKLSNKDRIEKVKQESQKRIDDVIAENKLIKDTTSKEAKALNDKLSVLQKEHDNLIEKLSKDKPEDLDTLVTKHQERIINKYLEEDKGKPLEQRREITQEEFEDWKNKDFDSAYSWQIRREVRRDKEKDAITNYLNFINKQTESAKKTERKHPELNTTVREEELKAEGKTREEIHQTLLKENEKYRLCVEITDKHPEWRQKVNLAELVVEEMEKQLEAKDKDPKETPSAVEKEMAELRQKLEDQEVEIEALKSGDVGINSSLNRNRQTPTQATEAEKQLITTMKEMNSSQEMIDATVTKLRAKVANKK